MNTAIINSDSYEKHNTGDGHPEQPKRVIAIKEKLKKRNDLIWETPVSVPDDILAMTHSKEYIENLNNSFPQKGLKFLDGDTVVSPESKKAVFDAAGSTIRAIDGIENNQFKNAFCLARPPGHHAEKNKAMGFCCISNAGIATNYLISKYKYKKVACVDFDVHWGNGKPGEVLSDYLELACGDNRSIKVIEIQRQGKRPQNIGEFMLGSQIRKGSRI